MPLPQQLNAAAWRERLATYPDAAAAALALRGIESGAEIGYDGPRDSGRVRPNLPIDSAAAHAAITADIAKELKLGRIAGPFDSPPSPNAIFSPTGAVPKKGTNEWRRIHHLSDPPGSSVNDFITAQELKYTKFDDAIGLARELGVGALLAKLDVKAAFRCIPVAPGDRHLLGFHWDGKFYIDLCLPFGLRSSPAIWERYAEIGEWAARSDGVVYIIHYVDDYLVAGRPGTDECQRAMDQLRRTFEQLGIPVNVSKLALEGTPSVLVKFLGVMLDTQNQCAYLDPQRVAAIKSAIDDWLNRDTATRHELQQLIGTLAFASKVVRSARPFVHRLTTALRHTSERRPFRIRNGLKADLRVWRAFIDQWNGVGLWYDVDWSDADTLQLQTDASIHGFGAVHGTEWFHGEWTADELQRAHRHKRESMPFLEMLALVKAAATWGHKWIGRKIVFHCDCMPVVQCISAGRTRNDELMRLLRTLHLIAHTHGFEFRCTHVSSVDNSAADILSRADDQQVSRYERFRSVHPFASPSPVLPLPLPTAHW